MNCSLLLCSNLIRNMWIKCCFGKQIRANFELILCCWGSSWLTSLVESNSSSHFSWSSRAWARAWFSWLVELKLELEPSDKWVKLGSISPKLGSTRLICCPTQSPTKNEGKTHQKKEKKRRRRSRNWKKKKSKQGERKKEENLRSKGGGRLRVWRLEPALTQPQSSTRKWKEA